MATSAPAPQPAARGMSSPCGLAGTELPQPDLPSHPLHFLEISISHRQKRGVPKAAPSTV